MQPATFYHLYNHANGSENLFRSDENYYFFLQKWANYINPVADTYAYCLMPNHIHFLIRIKEEEELKNYFTSVGKDLTGFENLSGLISRQFSNLFNSYAKAYNELYNRKGSLFIRPFKRKEVNNDTYLTRIISYIHFNPVHHGFVKDIYYWPHSSYHSLLHTKRTALKREEVLEWFGGSEAFKNFHYSFKKENMVLEMEF